MAQSHRSFPYWKVPSLRFHIRPTMICWEQAGRRSVEQEWVYGLLWKNRMMTTAKMTLKICGKTWKNQATFSRPSALRMSGPLFRTILRIRWSISHPKMRHWNTWRKLGIEVIPNDSNIQTSNGATTLVSGPADGILAKERGIQKPLDRTDISTVSHWIHRSHSKLFCLDSAIFFCSHFRIYLYCKRIIKHPF